MKKTFLLSLLLTLLGTVSAWAQAPVATPKQAITGLLNRIGGDGAADKFEIVIDANLAENGKDVFVITSQSGKPCIKGNTQLSVATGINWYLNHYAHINLTWNNLTTDLSGVSLPVPGGEEKHVCNTTYRYDFNTCTFSYSMAFWTWERWQQEIDWMALHGINAPLNLVGLEVVTRNFLRELGVSENDINAYIAGPGFIAWFAMNNLEGWGGTIESRGTGVFMQGNPDWWYTRQEQLCRNMLQRMRELGMQPVIPGFSGQVPNCIVNYTIDGFSSGDVVDNGTWAGGYTRPDILKPNTTSYQTFAAVYYKHLHEVMGVSELYSIDPFHEGSLPSGVSNETCYPNIMVELDKHFGNVEQSVKDTYKVTKSPSWMIQYWQGVPQSGAFTAMKNAGYASRFIGLDLFADNIYADNAAKWRTNYYDTCPYIYCMLHNFGGRSGLHGRLETTMDGYFQALEKNNNCQGIGATPEGTETNPILYDMLFELPWMNSNPGADAWLEEYAHSRYGVQNDKALSALKNLKKSVWDCKVNQQGTSEAVILARPNWTIKSVSSWSTSAIYWDTQDVLQAADELYVIKDIVTANGGQDGIANYNYDFIDVVRQSMVDYAAELLPLINAARGNDAEYTRLYQLYLQLMLDLDEMLSYDENFKLERWTSLARNIADEVGGTTENDRNWLEWNARTQVTVWSKGNTDLHDYSNRCWAGLIKDFHYKRWEKFFTTKGGSFDGGWFSGFEYPWTVDFTNYNYSTVTIPNDMTATEKAAETFGNYFGRIKGATKNYIFPMGVTRKATKSDVIPEVYRGKTVELPLIIGKNVTITSVWIDLNNDGSKGNGETLTATNNQVSIPADAAIGKTTAQVVYSDGTDITFNLALVEDITTARTVTAVAGDNGSVAIEGTDALTVTNKDAVKMMATANTGYNFENWTDAADNVVSNDNPFIYYGKEEATFTANFIQDKWGVPNMTGSGLNQAVSNNQYVNKIDFAYRNREAETIYDASTTAPTSLFTTIPQIINVPQGASFTISWTDNGSQNLTKCFLSAYMDFDGDGNFEEEGELVKVVGTRNADNASVRSGSFQVVLPYDAPVGITHLRMRFDSAWGDQYNSSTGAFNSKGELNRMCYEIVLNVTEKSDKAATINVETNNADWGTVEVWTDETPDGSTGTEWVVSANIPMYLRATKTSEDVEFLGWYDHYGRLLANELEYTMYAREDATYTAKFRKALDIDGWVFEYRTEPGSEVTHYSTTALANGVAPTAGKKYYIAAHTKSGGVYYNRYLYDNSGNLATSTSIPANCVWTCIDNGDNTFSFQNESGNYLADSNNTDRYLSIGATAAKYTFADPTHEGVTLKNAADYTGGKCMVTKADGTQFNRYTDPANDGSWSSDYLFFEGITPDVVILTSVRKNGDHDLKIPETVEILGEQCKIVGFDNGVFNNNKDLWTISLPSTIEFLSEKSLFNHTLTGNGGTQTFDVDIKNNEGWTITMDVVRTGELTGWGSCLIASGSNPAKPDGQDYAEGFQFYLQSPNNSSGKKENDKLIIKTKTQTNDAWYFDDVYQEPKFTVVINYNGAQQLSVNVLKADGTNATNHNGQQGPVVFTDCTIQDIKQLCTNVQSTIAVNVEIDKAAESDPFEGCTNLFDITVADGCSYYVADNKLYNTGNYALHTLADEEKEEELRALGGLIDNTEALMDVIATSINPTGKATGLPLTTEQGEDFYVSSNADQNTGGGDNDGGGIAALVDNNEGTYFHTRWGGTVVNEPHYIQVDLGANNLMNYFKFTYKPRNGSPAPTAMTVYGSNDGTNFTDVLATIKTGLPAHDSGKTYESSAIDSKKYRYLRFTVTGSDGPGNEQYGNQYFFGMLEFDLFKLTSTVEVDAEYKELAGITNDEAAEVYDNLVNALYVYNNGGTAEELQAAYDALEPLYSAVNEKKSKMEYVRELNELIPATNELIDAVTVSTTTGVPVALALTTTEGQPNYIWCNAPTANEGVGNLIDNDPGTILHTKWNAGAVGAYDHYLLITLGEEYKLANLKFRYKARTGNSNQMNMGDIPSGIKVYGSNEENGDYEELYTVSGLSQTSGYDWTSPAIDAKSYRYLRFNVTANSGFWHMAEFDLFKLIEVAPVYKNLAGITNEEATAAYDNMVTAQALCSNGTAEELEAALNALRTSYETLNDKKGKVLNGVYHINFGGKPVFVANSPALNNLTGATAGYRLFDATTDNTTDAEQLSVQNDAIGKKAAADELFTIVPNSAFTGYTISAQGLYMKAVGQVSEWCVQAFSTKESDAGIYLFEGAEGLFKLKCANPHREQGWGLTEYVNDWGPVFGNDRSNNPNLSTFSFTPVTEYTFNVTSVGMATLCLPFNVVLPEGMYAYDLAESKITPSGDVAYAYMDVIAEEGDVLKAGTPVIVKAAQGSYTLAITMDDTNAKGALVGSLLKGNFVSQTLTQEGDNKKFIFAKPEGKDLGFYIMDAEGTIGANKCWMEWTVPAGQAEVRSFVISFDDATGISDIIPETKENSTHLIYNISGQRLNKPQKGLNIVNGKKTIY